MPTIDPATQKYYDDYFDTFATTGWSEFIEEMRRSLIQDCQSAMNRCDTADKWFEERGKQLKTLRMLSFEDSIRNSYEQLVVNNEDDSLED